MAGMAWWLVFVKFRQEVHVVRTGDVLRAQWKGGGAWLRKRLVCEWTNGRGRSWLEASREPTRLPKLYGHHDHSLADARLL